MKTKKTSKKKPQIFMQEVDRTLYDPKTGKTKNLPDGEKIPIKFSRPKKPLKNFFEKMIGFKLNGNEHRACLRILDRAMNHQRINPQEIYLNESDEESFLRGCYGIVISLLEEKKLISRKFTAHYPAIMDKGMKALKFLKGFCDDKCCSGC